MLFIITYVTYDNIIIIIAYKIQILAGMNKAAGPELAAAVTNNGGLGYM